MIDAIDDLHDGLSKLNLDLHAAKSELEATQKRIWKLENPPKFSVFQEVLGGVLIVDLRIYTDNHFGCIARHWEYNIVDKNNNETYWIPQHTLEAKINQSNKKQTNKNKKK